MKIAIVGTGGVGGYFGGRLAAAGEQVAFIARGAHLAALRQRGLRIDSPLGNLSLPSVTATDDPRTVGPVDIVFFTVKLYDTDSAIAVLPPLVGSRTLVIPFQNGVDAVEALTRVLGPEHVAGGTTYIVSTIAEPGVIRHGALGRLIFGPLDGAPAPELERLFDACTRAGIDTVLSDSVMVDIWAKFVRLSAFSGVTALTRCPIGPVFSDPEVAEVLRSALEESVAVARASGINLPRSAVEDIWTALGGMPPDSKSSMLADLERGRPLELPWLSGAVVRLGRKFGVPTPTHAFITAALKPHVTGAASRDAVVT
jgi:2-dehydropantoate 2-reductase